MTWSEVLRVEARRLRAQEDLSTACFEEMERQVSGETTRAILTELIDEAPSRLGRLEVALAFLDGTGGGLPLHAFEGWREDVRELGRGDSRGETHDAAVLSLLLRATRTRTSCYEVAYVLARYLGTQEVASLLGMILTTDQKMDGRVAETLARVVLEGEGRWELGSLTA